MNGNWLRFLTLGVLVVTLACAGCGSDGSDGRDGTDGADGDDGQDGVSVIDVEQVSDEVIEGLDVVSEITNVEVASPPVVTFTLATSAGVPIIGIVPYWEDSNRYVRFTMTKLVPGTDGDPNSWVAYTRDGSTNAPDYDTGSSLVDNGDGSYEFTFNTDVMAVAGVLWEPTLTHRVAGQIGSSSEPLEPQNMFYDYVPAGGAITTTRNIAVMETCNECHDDLVFHGRRFLVEYCVQCHNPDLADGEGDMAFMIHKIHNAGTFDVLDDAIDYSYVTYPQGLNNCRKCHREGLADAPDADNWKNLPNLAGCFGCHDTDDHNGGPAPGTNTMCQSCHPPEDIEEFHLSTNATPNNPFLLEDQPNITYELIEATIGVGDSVIVRFKIFDDGAPIDITSLPVEAGGLILGPSLLLAWAEPQDGIDEPGDYNNMGNRAAQPNSVSIASLVSGANGSILYDGPSGEHTATVTHSEMIFPSGATMRAVGLQGYLVWDLNGNGNYDRATEVGLHTLSWVVRVGPVPPDDDAPDLRDEGRRVVIDSMKCANCHEWFEGHGGNRVGGLLPGQDEDNLSIQICTLCHLPNQSSSGRTVTDPTDRDLDDDLQAALDDETLDPSVDPNDPLTYPEDAQNLKDMVHAIHASGPSDHGGFRTRPYQHVRGPGRQGYYDWSHVSFPRNASTSNCSLCHHDGTWELPLDENVLPTTVRTTGEYDGMDVDDVAVEAAFAGVPNDEDWINSATSSSCFYCHTSEEATAHMLQNGAQLSDPSLPIGTLIANRDELGDTVETCTVCHGPGKTADVDVVHNR